MTEPVGGAFVPRPEQKAAIQTPGNLLLRAGAGSGKTEVLARRFVALLAGDIAGVPPMVPEQIAAVTFNEKAAFDMKERIGRVLAERVAAEPAGERLEHLLKARRRLALARISTLHAFCARILSENPLEAGLDPNFEVLDEFESRMRVESVAREMLIRGVRESDPGACYLVGRRGMNSASVWREGAVDIVVRLIAEMERLGMDGVEVISRTDHTVARIAAERGRVNAVARETVSRIEALFDAASPSGTLAAKIEALRQSWPRHRAVLLDFSADTDPGTLDALRDLSAALPDRKSKEARDIVDALLALINRDGPRKLGGTLVEVYGEQRAGAPMLAVARLLARVAGELETRRRRDRVVTFNDLLVLTLRMIRNVPSVARRLRTSIRALLVDEYQDTDPVQDGVVRELTRIDGAGEGPQYFIVGDEKQSIYRFRGADVTVLGAERSPTPIEMRLSENGRSVANLLDFVNEVNSRVMKPPPGAAAPFWIAYDDAHRLHALRDGAAEPAVEILVPPAGTSGAIADQRRIEATALANRIAELLNSGVAVVERENGRPRPLRAGDVAILMSSLGGAQIYQRALDEAGLDFYTVKGRGFFGCVEVVDLVNLLAAVVDPDDAIALAAALRSPLLGVSDQALLEIALELDRRGERSLAGPFAAPADFAWLAVDGAACARAWRILHELRAMVGRARAAEVLDRAIALTDIEPVLLAGSNGRQRVANLRKLVELARRLESIGLFNSAELIGHFRRLASEEKLEPEAQIVGEQDDVVRLMTIHQAKGLEFPIVALADMGREPPSDPRSILIAPTDGILCCDTIGAGDEEIPNPLITAYRKIERARGAAESARLLYVAMTRARDRLILCDPGYKSHWARRLMREVLGNDLEAFARAPDQARATIQLGHASIALRRTAAPTIPRIRARPQDADDGEVAALIERRAAFVTPAQTELITSPTALADFERCPRQYEFRHVLGLPEGGTHGGSGHALELGSVAHAVLQRLDPSLSGAELRSEIARLVAALAISLSSVERAALIRDLAGYAAARDPTERLLGRELPFFLRVADEELSLFVRGRIDVLVEREGGLVVRDYKYARAERKAAAGYALQMESYALAASEAHPERSVAAELVFIRERAATVPVELPDAAGCRTRLLKAARAMLASRAASDYPRKPTDESECRALGCGYISRCWRSGMS